MLLLKNKNLFSSIFISFLLLNFISSIPLKSIAQNDEKVFGDSIFITNGLTGKIYLLPAGTRKLPDFDTMKPVNTIYADKLDIPVRSWTAGFPGLRDRFEWFGIEYSGYFIVNKKGDYHFRLLSDDGSKLFIDDSLIINNDGLHGAYAKSAEISLDDSRHSIRIDYFQGPRFQIALQLFNNFKNDKEEIFPGGNFKLYTQKPSRSFSLWWYVASGMVLILFLFFIWRRRKRETKNSISK